MNKQKKSKGLTIFLDVLFSLILALVIFITINVL